MNNLTEGREGNEDPQVSTVQLPLPEELRFFRVMATRKAEDVHVNFEIFEKQWGSPDELILKGYVKWDGCSNWSLEHPLHFCGRKAFAKLGLVWELCWDHAMKVLGETE